MVDAPPSTATSDEKTWLVVLHVSALSGMVVPLGNVIGPLVVWLLRRPESELIDRQGKAALNFQISSTIYFVIMLLLMIVVIGFLLVPLYGIFWFVMVIVATVRAADGREPGYLLGIPFLR